MTSVNTLHPEYMSAVKRWELIRDIIGNNAIKHIRKPDVNDPVRCAQYAADAILTNFTNLTKQGLTGLVFRKSPKLSLPAELSYLERNFTGTGITLEQFTQHTTSETIALGRYGMLVDYNNNGRAYIKPYVAESIINWKTKDVDGESVLSLLVLMEDVIVDKDDVFSQETTKQYRVLRLSEDNIYYQEIYNADFVLTDVVDIVDFNGVYLNRIPFIFLGSQNNDACVDYQPLYDLAVVNLGHYRNSADYEESIYICGQPYLHLDIGDQSSEEFTATNPNGVAYGSRKGVITSHGSVSLVQANPNQLVAQAMKEKLEQAAAIGARLISPSGGRETAEAAKIRYGSQHSALYTLTSNVSDGIEDAIKLACLFMGANQEAVVFYLNDEFYDEVADANLVAQMILMAGNGLMSVDEVRDYGVRTGFIPENSAYIAPTKIEQPETPVKTTPEE
jgi:hypothetical protein